MLPFNSLTFFNHCIYIVYAINYTVVSAKPAKEDRGEKALDENGYGAEEK
jgi:hypothetical protein